MYRFYINVYIIKYIEKYFFSENFSYIFIFLDSTVKVHQYFSYNFSKRSKHTYDVLICRYVISNKYLRLLVT